MRVCVCMYISTVSLVYHRIGVKSASAHMFSCVFHRCLRIDSWVLACVCVYVCIHVHIYCIACVVGVKRASAHMFSCVFHRCLRMDGWVLACVCVYVCILVHIYCVTCWVQWTYESKVHSGLCRTSAPLSFGACCLWGFSSLSGGISIVKCNVTRPCLGREGGVTVTAWSRAFVLYKEKVPFTGPLFYVSFDFDFWLCLLALV